MITYTCGIIITSRNNALNIIIEIDKCNTDGDAI